MAPAAESMQGVPVGRVRVGFAAETTVVGTVRARPAQVKALVPYVPAATGSLVGSVRPRVPTVLIAVAMVSAVVAHVKGATAAETAER